MTNSEGSKNSQDKSVKGVFLFGKFSATLIIPAEIAHQSGLDQTVVIETKYGGLFIHKDESM